MSNTKTYWKGIEELSNDPAFLKEAGNEFPDFLSVKDKGGEESISESTNRRDFLKLLGFGVAAVSLAACEAPVKKVVPYIHKPVDVEPGVANYYASTYVDGGDYCSIVVKTREGRPVKIEGNPLSGITKGGTSARVQASLLSLYDSTRLKAFAIEGKETTPAGFNFNNRAEVRLKSAYEHYSKVVDAPIIDKLQKAQAEGKAIRIVTQTVLSPTTKAILAEFKAKYPATEVVTYDPSSAHGILKANEKMFAKRVLPSYDFSKANVIVSFGADFLGTWLSPIEFARQYAAGRKLSTQKRKEFKDGKTSVLMNRHYQFETNLSLTGSNADHRKAIKPSQEGLYVAALYNEIVGGLGTALPKDEAGVALVKQAAADLKAAKGQSLVVSGSNDANVQMLVNAINDKLGNYEQTLSLSTPSYIRQGDDEQMNTFINDVKTAGAVIFLNANPVYDHPRGAELAEGLKSVGLRIAINERLDETASLCSYVCPDHHYLESWGDAMPKKGFYSLIQPTVQPVYCTRSAQESLLIWAGNSTDQYTYLTNFWRNNILSGASFDKTLQDGVFEGSGSATVDAVIAAADTLKKSVDKLAAEDAPVSSGVSLPAEVEAAISATYKAENAGIELKLYEKVGIGTGSQASNPWLQELPDPISKATWDNYLAVPMSMANKNGWNQGDEVSVKVANEEIKLPVLIQPGQAVDTVSIALGYGRNIPGKKEIIGKKATGLATILNGAVAYHAFSVTLSGTGGFREIAQTQTHHTIMNRPIIQDASLEEYIEKEDAGRFKPTLTSLAGKNKKMDDPSVSAWMLPEHKRENHSWQMAIDLNSCIGCGACVVSCTAENNVATVGRSEVIRRREMHWIRIDRYYSSAVEENIPTGKYFNSDYKALEIASENPQVTFQPMMCQHCNHAPCETVCPVAATTHSMEGLNQMAYNRCYGTRYCANNCPYKVRRFNWFKYFDNPKFSDNISQNDAMGRWVLNPDVTVRSRGVMEKCSMCVQRIQEGKLKAKKEKRIVEDKDVNTACASACPTNAITFGDFNNANSAVYKEKVENNMERSYAVLEELNVQPNLHYLTKIRNTKSNKA